LVMVTYDVPDTLPVKIVAAAPLRLDPRLV
jgi:hypothetical protein